MADTDCVVVSVGRLCGAGRADTDPDGAEEAEAATSQRTRSVTS